MKSLFNFTVCGLVAFGLSGCSGGSSELKPVAPTNVDPAVAHAKMEAMKKESMEKAKANMGATPPGQ